MPTRSSPAAHDHAARRSFHPIATNSARYAIVLARRSAAHPRSHAPHRPMRAMVAGQYAGGGGTRGIGVRTRNVLASAPCLAHDSDRVQRASLDQAADHASPSTAAIFRCAYALPVLGFAGTWLEDRRFGGRGWHERKVAVYAGVFFAADLILWHNSIEDVASAGLATVLGGMSRSCWCRWSPGPCCRRSRPGACSRRLPIRARRCAADLRRGRARRLGGRESRLRGALFEARRRDRVLRVPAVAAPRRRGPSPAGRPAVRRDRDRGGDECRRRARDRGCPPGAGLARGRLADRAGADLAGVRVAVDLGVAAAASWPRSPRCCCASSRSDRSRSRP